MYDPNMYPHSAPTSIDPIHHLQMMSSTSSYPQDLTLHASTSAYSKQDLSTCAADARADTTNNDEDGGGVTKRRRVQRACDVSSQT